MSPHQRRAVRCLTASLLVGAAVASGCGKEAVTVVLHDQDAVRDTAAWAELVVYPGGCRPDADEPATDAAFRAVVPADADFPTVGDLPRRTFGFAAILRDANCRVVASGCTEANLERVVKINIFVVTPTTAPPGCPGACNEGSCRGDKPPASGGAGGGGGSGGAPAQCLALTRELPLPVAVSPSPTITAPTVIATADGFLIVYRERGGAAQKDLVTALAVDRNGDPGAITPVDISSCPAGARTDDVGIAAGVSGNEGLVLADRPACTGDVQGLDFVTLLGLDPAGNLSLLGSTTGDGSRKVVTSGASVVSVDRPDRFAIIYRENAKDDNTTDPPLSGRVLLVKPSNFSYASAATSIIAPTRSTYAAGALLGASDLRVFTGDGQTLRMDSFDVAKDVGTASLPALRPSEDLGPAQRVAIARAAPGVLVAQQVDKKVTLTNMDATSRPQVVATSTATPLSVALASSKTHAFLARGSKGAVELSAFARTAFTKELKAPAFTLPTLATWPGDKLGLAAGNGIVLMAWTQNPAAAGATVGGYALFACAEK